MAGGCVSPGPVLSSAAPSNLSPSSLSWEEWCPLGQDLMKRPVFPPLCRIHYGAQCSHNSVPTKGHILFPGPPDMASELPAEAVIASLMCWALGHCARLTTGDTSNSTSFLVKLMSLPACCGMGLCPNEPFSLHSFTHTGPLPRPTT